MRAVLPLLAASLVAVSFVAAAQPEPAHDARLVQGSTVYVEQGSVVPGWVEVWNNGTSPAWLNASASSTSRVASDGTPRYVVQNGPRFSILVGAGASDRVPYSIFATADTPLGEYDVTDTLTWSDAPEAPPTVLHQTVVVELPHHGVTFMLALSPIQYAPSGGGTITLDVTNAADVDHDAIINATIVDLPGRHNLTAARTIPANSTVRWPIPLLFDAPIPADAKGEYTLDVELTLADRPGPSSIEAQHDRLFLEIVDARSVGASLAISPANATVGLGGNVTYEVGITETSGVGGTIRLEAVASNATLGAGPTVEVDRSVVTLAPFETVSVPLRVRAGPTTTPGAYVITARATLDGSGDLLAAENASFVVDPAATLPLPSPPATAGGPPPARAADLPGGPIVVGASVGAAVVGAAVVVASRRERVRYAVVSAILPLYTRMAKPELLTDERRGQIHALVTAEPGICFTALRAATGLSSGALVHHLRMLERHEYVASHRDGRLRRFYAGRAPDRAAPSPTAIQDQVLGLLAAGPLTRPEIGARLGLSQQGVSYHVKNLERAGRVRVVREGGRARVHRIHDLVVATPDERPPREGQ